MARREKVLLAGKEGTVHQAVRDLLVYVGNEGGIPATNLSLLLSLARAFAPLASLCATMDPELCLGLSLSNG